MRVLHINSYFSTSKLFKQLFDRQVASGCDISVYVPIAKQYPEERIAAGGDYTLIRRTFNQPERFIFHLKHYKILADLLKQYDFEKFGLIHAHSLFSNGWLAYQIHKKFAIPYIVACRSADIRTFFGKQPWLRPLGLEIMKNAAQIFFISQNSYDEVFDNYIPENMKVDLADKTQVIANGIEAKWHEHKNTQKNQIPNKPLQIVATAKLLREKQLVQVGQMVHKYNQEYAPAQFHVIGPAWDKHIAAELQKIPEVIYHGAKNIDEMIALYRKMDIFALLSSRETFGLVYAEAMSQGLPVIYTTGEGFDSFFPNHEVGVSVDRHVEDEFFQAIDAIIADYPQYVNNALKGVAKFDWDDITATYLAIYQAILK